MDAPIAPPATALEWPVPQRRLTSAVTGCGARCGKSSRAPLGFLVLWLYRTEELHAVKLRRIALAPTPQCIDPLSRRA